MSLPQTFRIECDERTLNMLERLAIVAETIVKQNNDRNDEKEQYFRQLTNQLLASGVLSRFVEGMFTQRHCCGCSKDTDVPGTSGPTSCSSATVNNPLTAIFSAIATQMRSIPPTKQSSPPSAQKESNDKEPVFCSNPNCPCDDCECENCKCNDNDESSEDDSNECCVDHEPQA